MKCLPQFSPRCSWPAAPGRRRPWNTDTWRFFTSRHLEPAPTKPFVWHTIYYGDSEAGVAAAIKEASPTAVIRSKIGPVGIGADCRVNRDPLGGGVGGKGPFDRGPAPSEKSPGRKLKRWPSGASFGPPLTLRLSLLLAPSFGLLGLGLDFHRRPRLRPAAVDLGTKIGVNFLEPIRIRDLAGNCSAR